MEFELYQFKFFEEMKKAVEKLKLSVDPENLILLYFNQEISFIYKATITYGQKTGTRFKLNGIFGANFDG